MTQMAHENPLLTRTGVPFLDLGADRRAERQTTARRTRTLVGVIAALAVYILVCLLPATFFVLRLRSSLAATEQVTVREQKAYTDLLATSEKANNGSRLWTNYQGSRERREAWRDSLPAAVALMPESVYISSVESESSSGSVIMSIRGSVNDNVALKRLADGLVSSPFFDGVRVTETAPDNLRAPNGLAFRLSARVGGALSAGAVKTPE